MNTNTKKHERAIKSLAAHCWDKKQQDDLYYAAY